MAKVSFNPITGTIQFEGKEEKTTVQLKPHIRENVFGWSSGAIDIIRSSNLYGYGKMGTWGAITTEISCSAHHGDSSTRIATRAAEDGRLSISCREKSFRGPYADSPSQEPAMRLRLIPIPEFDPDEEILERAELDLSQKRADDGGNRQLPGPTFFFVIFQRTFNIIKRIIDLEILQRGI
ncbi:hypothetical protein C8R44DRAFT_725093 [Mycena epipterygia]|nr:hypothetical protein C8R44DRAFT_725093 [Mycena epipterygia]